VRTRLAVYDFQDACFMPVSRLNTVQRPGPTVLIYRKVRWPIPARTPAPCGDRPPTVAQIRARV